MKKASKHVEFVFDERSRSKEGDPCFCPCHMYPGAYPTSREKPCIICHHVDDDGHLRGTSRDGWIQDHEPEKQPLDANEMLLYLAGRGITISIVYGPCGDMGIHFSVDVLTKDCLCFEKPFLASSFDHAVEIAYKECLERKWIS